MKKPNLAQSAAEYFIIMAVIVAALLATGFVGKVRDVFKTYFNKAANTITVNK